MSAYGYENIGAEKPLFGETKPQDRVINLIVGGITALSVTVTLVCSFVFPKWPPVGVNIYFSVCILLLCGTNLLLIHWYRQGDVEPKFRTLIYMNAFIIILLCVCANLYIHDIK